MLQSCCNFVYWGSNELLLSSKLFVSYFQGNESKSEHFKSMQERDNKDYLEKKKEKDTLQNERRLVFNVRTFSQLFHVGSGWATDNLSIGKTRFLNC